MPEQNHIAVLHDVLFPFQPHLRLLSRRREATCLEQVFPLHDIRLDEILFDVAVDRARGLLRAHPALNRPRAAFRLAASEKRNQSQQTIARLDQPVAPRFREAVRLHHLRRFRIVQLRKLRFDLAAERNHRRLRLRCQPLQVVFLDHAVNLRRLFIAQIQYVEHRFARQEHEAGQHLHFFRLEFQFAQRSFGFERQSAAVQKPQLCFEYCLFLFLQIFFDALDPLRALFEVGQDQLEIHVDDVAQRVERPAFVRHRRILEQSHDVRQRVGLAQRYKRRGIFLAIFLQPADIHVLDRRVRDFLRLERLGKLRHARIRHARDPHVRLTGNASPGCGGGPREYPEQTRLPYLWQSDNSCLHKRTIVA